MGGLVGKNHGTVKRSSSSGTVSGGLLATLGGLVGANYDYVGQSSTTSRVAFTGNAGQRYGALAGVNEGELVGDTAYLRDASVPLVGYPIASANR